MPARTLKCLLLLVLASSLLAGCQVLQTIVPPGGDAGLQYERITRAQASLAELGEAEALLRLNNRWLAQRIEEQLQARITLEERYQLRRLDVDFVRLDPP